MAGRPPAVRGRTLCGMARDVIHETSAGGIVFDRGDLVLIAVHKSGRDVWTLPKGHPDGAETLQQAAVREVREETGLEVRVGARLPDLEYWYAKAGGARVHKRVAFWLMERIGGDPADHDAEVVAVEAFPPADALSMLAYENERSLVLEAFQVAGVGVAPDPRLGEGRAG